MGVYDDFLNISYIKKIIIQFCISGLFVYKTNLLLPMEQFDPGYFYSFSFIITILYIMLVMNSFNLIDGADGLAAVISIIGFLFFSIIFFINGNVYFTIFSLSLMAIISAFLVFNFSPAKIFMGDSGSLFLGMVMASLSIVIIRDQNIFNQDQNILYKVLFSFSAISLPIFEVLRLIITRLKNRSNPFKGDNNHLHHILKRNHFSNAKKLLYITICQMILLLNTIITIDYSLIVCIVINLFIYSSFIVLIPAVSRYMGIGKLV